MQSSQITGNGFFETIGKLFYAMAMADRMVHINELDRLKEIVSEHWLELEMFKNTYGTDDPRRIEFVFDRLLETERDSETCFQEFVTFYKAHPNLFSGEIKKLISHTSHAIAEAYSGKNKAELVRLAKLHLLME